MPAFAQVLQRAGLLARCSINTTGGSEALDVRSQAPFIARPDRDPGSPFPGRERPDSSGSDAANRTWPAGSWCVDSSGGCGSVQVCRVVWSGLPPVQPRRPP